MKKNYYNYKNNYVKWQLITKLDQIVQQIRISLASVSTREARKQWLARPPYLLGTIQYLKWKKYDVIFHSAKWDRHQKSICTESGYLVKKYTITWLLAFRVGKHCHSIKVCHTYINPALTAGLHECVKQNLHISSFAWIVTMCCTLAARLRILICV